MSVFRFMFLKKFLKKYSPLLYSLYNLSIFYFLWYLNTYKWQSFCVPVDWAQILLIACVSTYILHFYKWPKFLRVVIWFLNGCFIWVCFYCAWFVLDSDDALMSIFYLFLPIIGPMIPIFILKFNFSKIDDLLIKRSFYIGLIVPFVILLLNACLYLNAYHNIQNKRMQHGYWEEKIVGMHFKYHTRMCLFDGWRPPMHEPMLVVFNRIIGDPLVKHSLIDRINIYKKEFPNEPIRVKCTCSEIPNAKTYLNDPVFD